MNAIYGSRIATFSPKMHLENANIDFIRPLILTHEKQIKALVKEEDLPVFGSHCPADRTTTREDIKTILSDLYHKYPSSQERILHNPSSHNQSLRILLNVTSMHQRNHKLSHLTGDHILIVPLFPQYTPSRSGYRAFPGKVRLSRQDIL